ncbi:phosphoribosylanthranilate isomerase [Cupriavidus pauculus]|nr:phosphoribosylanthranilate isomerase [Cupriavidus pauculus]
MRKGKRQETKMMRHTFAKVCGLTTEQQIDWAVELGYDAIGIVVSPRSKRYCSPETAVALAKHAQGRVSTFVVALRYDEVSSIAAHFDIVQLYEMASIPNHAFSSATPPSQPTAMQYFFYDASVGSGIFNEIPTWVQSVPGKVVIAGGLNAENVQGVIERYSPYGVDVSSGVETAPGIKSQEKMLDFIKAVRCFPPALQNGLGQ